MAALRALVDKPLVDVSNGLFQDETMFVAERLLTPVGVKQRSGIVGSYGTNHLRIHANAMGGRGEAPRVALVQPNVANKYLVQAHGLEEIVTPDDYDDYELPFDAERDKTMTLTYANLIAKEYALATALGSAAGTITQNTTLTGASQFSDLVNSDPIGVFLTARETVRDTCGFYPSVAWAEAAVNEKLRVHPQLWDRLGFKYNQSGQLTQDNVAAALNVKKFLVCESVYDSSSEGQTAAITSIWGKSLFFATIAANPAIMQKTLGYYVFLKRMGSRVVYKYAINNPAGSTGIQCQDVYDQLLSDAGCCYAVYGAVA